MRRVHQYDAGGGRAREETPVQVEREPAFEPRSAGEHEDSHPLPLLVRSLRQRNGEERSSQVRRRKERTKGSSSLRNSSRRTTLMIRQIRRATRSSQKLSRSMGSLAMAVPGKGSAAAWIAKRVADWLDRLGSYMVTLKCESEPATLAREIRRSRREK